MNLNGLTSATPRVYTKPEPNFTPNHKLDVDGGPSDKFSWRGCMGGSEPTPGPGPGPDPDPGPGPAPKKWTVMVYSCSDNNLYRFMQADLDEAEKVGSTDQMNVIAYTDHAPKGGSAGFYQLETNSTAGLNSPVKVDRGSRNLGDPKELSEFIQWGMKNYPAENYFLVISDHGAAWQGACHDENGPKEGWMTLPQIEEGLKDAREKTGRQLDVIGFDACLMANMEVAHQLKDEAKFLVASEETEGGAGWQYNRVLSKDTLAGTDAALRARLDYSPRDMAEGVVRMAKGNQGDLPTMSAVDLSKVPELTAAVDNFGKAILASSVANADLARVASKAQGFYMEKDLFDFADKVSGNFASADPALADAANAVKAAVEQSLVAEQHSARYPGAHGITIELNAQRDGEPVKSVNPNVDSRMTMDKYSNTKFAQETSFDEAVKKFRG